jgi:hypothetical protein
LLVVRIERDAVGKDHCEAAFIPSMSF